MKISCLPVSIFKDICSDRMDLVDWAGVAKEIGYDGIDISKVVPLAQGGEWFDRLHDAEPGLIKVVVEP